MELIECFSLLSLFFLLEIYSGSNGWTLLYIGAALCAHWFRYIYFEANARVCTITAIILIIIVVVIVTEPTLARHSRQPAAAAAT